MSFCILCNTSCEDKYCVNCLKNANVSYCEDRYCENLTLCCENYCGRHLDKTTQEYANIERQHCTGCKNNLKKEAFKTSNQQCIKCLFTQEITKKNKKEKDKENTCKAPNCKFTAGKNKTFQFKEYCGKHQNYALSLQENYCKNFIRGCRNILPKDYKYKKCNECLQKDKIYDNKKYKNKIEKSIKENEEKENEDLKLCEFCHQDKPRSTFKTILDKLSHKCEDCLQKQREIDSTRGKRNRNYVEELKRNPDRLKKKNEWKEANKNKLEIYWKRCRENRKQKMGEEYWKHNAKIMAEWRKNNPDAWTKIDNKYRRTFKYPLKYYKYRAKKDNIKWELTDEEAIKLFNEPCFYCHKNSDMSGEIIFRVGIDRLDNNEGYIAGNVCSCCTICNFMKLNAELDTFIYRCIHIASHNELISEELRNFYPEVFYDVSTISYRTHVAKAKDRGIEQHLSKEQYDDIVHHNCYLCGKSPSNEHKNGIDRFDNSLPYVFENCRSCCGCCNFIKNKFPFEEILFRCTQVAINCKWIVEDIENDSETLITNHFDNVFKEDKRVKERNKKVEQRRKLREELGDVEYRRKMANERAKTRTPEKC